MKLIDNWRDAPRMISVRALALIAAVQSVLAVVPNDYLDLVVPFTAATTWRGLAVALTIAAAAIGAIGRLIDQSIATDPAPPEPPTQLPPENQP